MRIQNAEAHVLRLVKYLGLTRVICCQGKKCWMQKKRQPSPSNTLSGQAAVLFQTRKY